MNNFKQKVDSFFKISERKSTIAREIVAGLVTFLSMAYILTVNPSQITAGFNGDQDLVNVYWPSIFIATAFGAIIGTLLMAFLAKLPLAQAPGMGLNAALAGLIGGWAGYGCTFGNSMLLVLISGVLFLLLSIITVKGISVRELIFDGIPESVRKAISVGIGLFIAYIGFQNAGLIITDNYTQVGLIDLTIWDKTQTVKYADYFLIGENGLVLGNTQGAIVLLVGILTIAVLDHLKVKGSVIFGIIVATLVGIPLGVTSTDWSDANWKFWEYFQNFFSFNSEKGGTFFAAFKDGFNWDLNEMGIPSIIMTIITFCMIDMFDTMGTVVGCCTPAGLVDEKGKPIQYNEIMLSDSIATCTGALLGTSTVTTFVESGSGVAAGGRTGLTALTTSVCFFLSIFLLPVIQKIPSAAASCALVYVGALMLKGALNLKLDKPRDLIASFFTIIMMPLSYSITSGIGFGLLSYAFITLISYVVDVIKYAFTKKKGALKPKFDLSVVCIIVCILFLVYFFVPVKF